jgi:5-hydroxyisourate hydrolase-like protein (transthyretin family)
MRRLWAIPILLCALLGSSLASPFAPPVKADTPAGGTISGVVTDRESGAPLEGIGVDVCQLWFNGCAWVYTAHDGTYTLDVPTGEASAVYVFDPNHAYATGFWGMKGDLTLFFNEAVQITLPAGQVETLDISVPAARTISGTVSAPDGGPASNANVALCKLDGDCWSLGWTATDADGRYTISSVPPSPYLLLVSGGKGAPYPSGWYSSADPGNFTINQGEATPVALQDGDATIDVSFPQTYAISGTVRNSDGSPAAGVRVNFCTPDGDCYSLPGTDTDADGYYATSLTPGSYMVFVSGTPDVPCPYGWYDASAVGAFTQDWSAATPVDVTQGDRDGIDITLPPTYTISGTVTGDAGVDLAGIDVEAWGPQGGAGNGGSATTDEYGRYAIRGLPADTYTVSFSDPDGMTYASGMYSSSGFTTSSPTPVVLATGDVGGIDISLPHGFWISGTVTDSDNNPLANVDVGSFGIGSDCRSARTDDSGVFHLGGFLAGSYTLVFNSGGGGGYAYGFYSDSAPGHFTPNPDEASAITLTDSSVTDIVVALPPSHTLSGTITLADGSRAFGVDIVLCREGGGCDWAGNPGTGDPHYYGQYSFAVVPGVYKIYVAENRGGLDMGEHFPSGYYSSATGLTPYRSQATPIDLTAGDATVDFTIPDGIQISGRVVGPDGSTGLAGISVQAWIGTDADRENISNNASFSGSDGSYAFMVLPGSYSFTLQFGDQSGTYSSGYYSAENGPANFIAQDTGNGSEIAFAGQPIIVPQVSIPMSGSPAAVWTSGSGTYYLVPEGGSSVSVELTSVEQPGATSVHVSADGPAPSGFSFGTVGAPLYYDLSTTAAYSGPVHICLAYDPAAFADPSNVLLYHYHDGAWTPLTDQHQPAPGTICGTATSLSPFVVGEPLTQAQSITFASLTDQTYGAAPIALGATASSGLPVGYAAEGACTVAGSELTLTGAGSCSVTASQPGDSSWAAAAPVTQSFTIEPAQLTVTADPVSKLLGAPNPALTATISGFVNGETLATSGVTGTPDCTTTATTTSSVGPYPIACSVGTLAASNYAFTFAPGTLSIVYRFDGFLQPINDTAHAQTCGSPCPMSVFKAGSTIPVKFALRDANGNVVQAASLPIWANPVQIGPLNQPIDETVTDVPASSGNTFRSDGSQYIYNWSTKGLKAGFIYRISAVLDDGTTQSVYIGLR